MEKRITYSQFQIVKNAAKMIDPIKRKMEPISKKIAALEEEYKGYQAQIEAFEAGVVQVMGFHVDDLVKKVIEPTGKTDLKTGKPITVTKYIGTDIVSYDEQKKEYVINKADAPSDSETPEEKPLEEDPAPAESTENNVPW